MKFGSPTGEFAIPEYATALIEHILCMTSKMDKTNGFEFNNVKITWYECPGRAMTCNVRMNEKGWVSWFNSCIAHIRKTENVCNILTVEKASIV
jgi:hypothetical protein